MTIRIGVIGCGAIAQQYHLPALQRVNGAKLVALVDPVQASLKRLGEQYDVKILAQNLEDLPLASIDAAIIATPSGLHAAASMKLLSEGIHVFVEKPMAINATDALKMVEIASEKNCCLGVGLFRRQYHSSILVKRCIHENWLGRPLRFEAEEGFLFDWPSHTLGGMRRETSGGGVLMDTGTHTLDLLIYFFGTSPSIISYEDNAFGGVESDCKAVLSFNKDGREVRGVLQLSRTRPLRNRFRIEFENGSIEVPTTEKSKVKVEPISKILPSSVTDLEVDTEIKIAGSVTCTAKDIFHKQLSDWVDSIRTSKEGYTTGKDAIHVSKAIDQCYRLKSQLEEPWVLSRTKDNQPTIAPMRVLITGASGFIGCRIAEVLSLRHNVSVVGMVRRASTASGVARLPIELVQADLRSADQVHKAVKGIDLIVHCAYGTDWGEGSAIRDTTVTGTKNLLDAAVSHGVKNVVHLSTWSVYGENAKGVVSEKTKPLPGDDLYSKTKLEAENLFQRAEYKSINALVLRLTNVYGPFSKPYTIRVVRDILRGVPLKFESLELQSNLIYVDNVVRSVELGLALMQSKEIGKETLLISDRDRLTWQHYFRHLADQLGTELKELTPEEERLVQGYVPGKTSIYSHWLRSTREAFSSNEMMSLLKKIYRSDPIGTAPRWLVERNRKLRSYIIDKILSGESQVDKNQPSQSFGIDPMLYGLYTRKVDVDLSKSRELLGDYSSVSVEDALSLTSKWVAEYRRLMQ
jgi:predicted dehydrogenase/nucleoside-diphosphate-sugar epimerase